MRHVHGCCGRVNAGKEEGDSISTEGLEVLMCVCKSCERAHVGKETGGTITRGWSGHGQGGWWLGSHEVWLYGGCGRVHIEKEMDEI